MSKKADKNFKAVQKQVAIWIEELKEDSKRVKNLRSKEGLEKDNK